ncbi:MAG: MFS transporter [Halanaeroarchaeum sp.]
MAARWWRSVAAVSAWQVTASVCFYSVFASTQFVHAAFDVSNLLVGVLITALMVGYTVALFPMGAAVDAYGEKTVLGAGLAGLGGASLALYAAPGFASLAAAVVALGVLYAVAMPGTNAAIVSSVPTARRNVAMGIKQVGVTAGSGIGALLVTGLAGTRYGWRAGFLAAAVVAFALAAAFLTLYEGSAGTGTLSVPDVRGLFAYVEYRRVTLAGAFLGAGLFTTTGYATVYLNHGLGLSATVAGVTLALAQVSGSVGRVVAGHVSDALDGPLVRTTARILLAQAVAAAALFLLVPFVSGTAGAVVCFVALGFVILGFTGVYYSCIGAIAPADEIGAATAGGQTALNVGAVVAPPVFGFVADAGRYLDAWWFLAALSLAGAGLLVSLARD